MDFVAPLLKELIEENKRNGRSLGIIKPDPGSLKFKVKPILNNDQSGRIKSAKQLSLFEDPLNPLRKPKYSFRYEYTCSGHSHKHQIHDWEVQAAYFNYKRRYGNEKRALQYMKKEYQNNIPKHNVHFVMGTMIAHPQTFILIGLLRTLIDPDELRKQTTLF